MTEENSKMYDLEAQGVPIGVAHVLNARYPTKEVNLMVLVGFVLIDRLPMTSSIIKAREQ